MGYSLTTECEQVHDLGDGWNPVAVIRVDAAGSTTNLCVWGIDDKGCRIPAPWEDLP
jgi:hypothetical protein